MSNDRIWLVCTAHDGWTDRVLLGKWWPYEMEVPAHRNQQLTMFFDEHKVCLPGPELDGHPWRLETEADLIARSGGNSA